MLDAGYILRQKYFQRLNNAVTYVDANNNTITVKVYDSLSVPEDASYPYLVLNSYTASEIGEGSKQSYGLETTLTVDVYDKFDNQFGGQKLTDDLANQVIQLVRTRVSGYLDLTPNFQVITILLDNTQNIQAEVATGWLNQRVLRFRHKLQQLTNNN